MERRGQQQDVAIACQPVDFDDVKHFCSWIHEANDKNFTKTAATHFPSYIRFNGDLGSNLDTRGLILPSDIDNLFYIIRASLQVFTLEVKLFCKFASNALSRFWKVVAESKTKIQSFQLIFQPISDDDSSCIVESLQHVQKLTLYHCGVSRNLVRALSEKWNKINANIEELDLGGNEKIDDEGFVILARLPGIRRLRLSCCDISSKGCAKFVEEIIKRNHELEFLDLGNNHRIGDDGARSLFRCFHLIEELELWGCDVTYAVEGEIRSELRRLNLPEHRVVFL